MTNRDNSPAPESKAEEEKDVVSDLGELGDFEFGTIDRKNAFAWSHCPEGELATCGTSSQQDDGGVWRLALFVGGKAMHTPFFGQKTQ